MKPAVYDINTWHVTKLCFSFLSQPPEFDCRALPHHLFQNAARLSSSHGCTRSRKLAYLREKVSLGIIVLFQITPIKQTLNFPVSPSFPHLSLLHRSVRSPENMRRAFLGYFCFSCHGDSSLSIMSSRVIIFCSTLNLI